jgi:LysM repeat protein
MRSVILYGLAGVFLALIVSVAWWTRDFPAPRDTRVYQVQPGDTPQGIADAFNVQPESLAQANSTTLGEFKPQPGIDILIPATEPTLTDVVGVHAAGIAAEAIGVLLSFWLGIVSGLLPRDIRRQVLGISLAIGIVSYAAAHAIGSGLPALTPQFVFASIKDGFAWSAAFPLFARAFGLREEPDT